MTSEPTETTKADLLKKSDSTRLECEICRERYSTIKWSRQPMVGSCGHSFCRGCTFQLNIVCALCRGSFVRPQVNFALIEILEELKAVKKELKKKTMKLKEERERMKAAGMKVEEEMETIEDSDEEDDIEEHGPAFIKEESLVHRFLKAVFEPFAQKSLITCMLEFNDSVEDALKILHRRREV